MTDLTKFLSPTKTDSSSSIAKLRRLYLHYLNWFRRLKNDLTTILGNFQVLLKPTLSQMV